MLLKRIVFPLFFTSVVIMPLSAQNGTRIIVTNEGIVNDGTTLNTVAIQKCIDRLNKNNGGVLYFPDGTYLSGTIQMKSNVSLYLESGATLLGSSDPQHYRTIEPKDAPVSPKTEDNSKLALLVAYDAYNISVSGTGTIDGQGRELALNIDSILYATDAKYRAKRTRPNETKRPKIINFMKCKNIKMENVTIKNSACWVQTYELCENLVIDGLKIVSRAYWNNDGMDITDCRNVRISNCFVDTADDGICLKSYYPGYYNDSVYISNCTVVSSASAVKFGTASIGGFKNIMIDNINIFDTYRSAIAIETVDGGFIENVKISRIMAKNTGNPLFIRIGQRYGEKPGTIRNVTISDMKVEVPFGRPDAAYDMRGPELPFFHNPFPSPIAGIPNRKIEGIALENIEIIYPGRASKGMAYIPLWGINHIPENIRDYPEFSMFGELPAWGFYIRHAKNIKIKNVRLKLAYEDFRPAIVMDDVCEAEITNLSLPDDKKEHIILNNSTSLVFDRNSKARSKEIKVIE